MKTSLVKGALALGMLSCAGSAAAQTASLIMEGAYDRPASNIPFCGPCMTLWFAGASPGGQVDFTLEQPFPSRAPKVESVKADELGVAVYPFKPSADGEVRIQAASGALQASPRTCTPPIARGARECPPPPLRPVRAQQGEIVAIPLDETLAAATRVALHELRTGADPRWEALPAGRAVLRVKPAREARIAGRGLRPGLYRLQFLDKDRHVVGVSLIEVKPKR